MADETVSIALDLEGGLASEAETSAAALEELRAAVVADTEALSGMQRALRSMKDQAGVSDGTVGKLKQQIVATKASIAQNNARLVESGASFKRTKAPIEGARASMADFARDLKELPGPLGRTGSGLLKLSGLTASGAIAAGIIGISAALVALTAATIAAGAALLGYAIHQADARRSEELRLQGLSKFRSFWREMVTGQRLAADSSGFLQENLDRVSASSALGRERIAEMQGELYRLGLRSGNLQQALEGLAIAEATQGQAGAEQFKALALGAHMYGTSIKKVTDDVKARLGGVAKAQLLSLDVQGRKLRENFSLLFKDLKIERVLEGLKELTDSFSLSTARGRALKAMIDGFFQPLINGASAAGIYVKRFFQGVIIGALQIGIALQKVRIFLKETFGDFEILRGIDKQRGAVEAGRLAVFLFAGALAAAAASAVILAGALLLIFSPIIAIGVAVYGAIQAFKALGAWFEANQKWVELGRQIALGIATGITGGTGAVVTAMLTMGGAAIKAFKQKLGIASPSRVAFAAAFEIPRGVTLAQGAGVPMVRRSAERLADASRDGLAAGYGRAPEASPPAIPQASAGAASRSTSISVTVAEGAIRVDGAQQPQETAEAIFVKLEERIVSAARSLGAS